MPIFASLLATDGTRATRFSCSRVSPGTNRLTGMGSPFTYCLFYAKSKTRASIHQMQLNFCRGFEIRTEEHTSELQSRPHLVCRLLLEKKKNKQIVNIC